jgi:predicted outer membrane repeat protein
MKWLAIALNGGEAMKFSTAMTRFDTQLRADGRSERTRQAYLRDLGKLKGWLSKDVPVIAITPGTLARFLAAGNGRQAAVTVNRTKTALRVLLFVIGCLLCSVLLPLGTAHARTWLIELDGTGDAPTIQAGIDSAAVGDSVILEGGTWYVHDINVKAGIYFAGVGGNADFVTLSADGLERCIMCDGLSIPTTIKGITFREGDADGGGAIYIYESSVTVADCRFEANVGARVGGAILASHSSVDLQRCTFSGNTCYGMGGAVAGGLGNTTVTDCVFIGNSAETGGAVSSSSMTMGEPSTLSLSGCLFLRNTTPSYGAGGAIYTCIDTEVANCTFAQNSGGYGTAIYLVSASPYCAGSLHITTSIVAQNTICCDVYSAWIYIDCSDLWESVGGCPTGDCIEQYIGTAGNFSLDPQFCDTASDNYNLKQCSPCAPGNHPDGTECGLIGAFPVDCPGTAVEPTTWGRIKTMFR